MTTSAIVVGIDDYGASGPHVRDAVRQAQLMMDWLLDEDGGGALGGDLLMLLGVDATHERIFEAVFNEGRRGAGDRLFFFFSGHALRASTGSDDTVVLLPADFTPKHPETSIPLSELQSLLRSSRIAEQFFFVDGSGSTPSEELLRDHAPARASEPAPDGISQFSLVAGSLDATQPQPHDASGEAPTFADILVDGLRGAAAGRGTRTESNQVEVSWESLVGYVEREFERWASELGSSVTKPSEVRRVGGGEPNPVLVRLPAGAVWAEEPEQTSAGVFPAGEPHDETPVGTRGGAVSDAVAEEDQLGFADYVETFADLITSTDAKPPLTIGIFGSWGMGKSFLLQHIEREITRRQAVTGEETTDASRVAVHVVHFNAWEYSANEVVWPGLVRKIVKTLDEDVPWPFYKRWWTRIRWNLGREVKRVRGVLLAALVTTAGAAAVALWRSNATLAAAATAIAGVVGLGSLIKAATSPIGRWITMLFQETDYGKQIGYMEEIKHDLEQLERRLHVKGRRDAPVERRILVVIDDLDRCEPEKAVEVLQAVNLLLHFKSFIVCMGIDARIVTAAVERHYQGLLGSAGASGYEYLDKIVQIPFRIPEPGEDEIRSFIAKQLGDPVRPGTAIDAPTDEPPSSARSRTAATPAAANAAGTTSQVAQRTVAPSYDVYLSHSARDDALASALKRGLETFAKPWYRRRVLRVFQPSGDLSATPSLWSSIEAALERSRFFVLVASPDAAASPWTAQEVEWWLEHRSPGEILIVLAEGELLWDAAAADFDWARTTALPAALRQRLVDEPRYVDLRWAAAAEDLSSAREGRFSWALADLAAPIWGVPKDELLEGKAVPSRPGELTVEHTVPLVDEPGAPEVAFTYPELLAFQDIAHYLRPNPRRLKRLVNVYWFVRALADKKDDVMVLKNPTATIRWLVVCDQWPYTAQAMLGRFADLLRQWEAAPEPSSDDLLLRLLDEVEDQLESSMRSRLDADADLLRGLLGLPNGGLGWNELRRIRRYTVNFNPAVEEQIRLGARRARPNNFGDRDRAGAAD